MKTHYYPSQTNNRDLFWLRDHDTGAWILGQQHRFKNGKPRATWQERLFLPATPEEMTEAELLAIFGQAESDLVFHDAAGEKSETVHHESLREHLDQFAKEPGTWKKNS